MTLNVIHIGPYEAMVLRVALLSIVSYFLGFLSGIPAGSVQVEVIKRALHDRVKPALAVIGGAFLADSFYGAVALMGLMPFLRIKAVMGGFELISAILLAILSYFAIKHRNKIMIGDVQHLILKSKRVSFLIGLSLGFTNPVIIFWWLLCAHIVSDIGLYDVFTVKTASVVIFFGAIGLATYLIILAFIVRWAHKFISPSFIKTINLVLGMLLAGLSLYFFISAVKCFI